MSKKLNTLYKDPVSAEMRALYPEAYWVKSPFNAGWILRTMKGAPQVCSVRIGGNLAEAMEMKELLFLAGVRE